MTVLGVGVDLVRTARFGEIERRSPAVLARLSRRVLHPLEQEAWAASAPARRLQMLASAWAAKEATFKSLSIGEQRRFRFAEWRRIGRLHGYEMVHDPRGAGTKEKEQAAPLREDQVLVSLSHDGAYTIAYALRQPLHVPK